MKKIRSYNSIILCIAFGFAVVWALNVYSRKMRSQAYDFERKFEPMELVRLRDLDVRYDSYYFAGVSGNIIYLGNHMAPLHLLAVVASGDTAFISIECEKGISTAFSRSTRIAVMDSSFYLIDGGLPVLLNGRTGTWKAHRFMYDSIFFIRAMPVTSDSFAFLAMARNKENVLGRLTSRRPHVKLFPHYLEKQLDGVFCTDGELLSDTDYVVFMYRYRNDYIVMDHSMEVLTKAKTISPIDMADINPHRLSSDNSMTLANPERAVNEDGVVHNGLLYIHSNIRARNDDAYRFDNSSVVDVHDLATQKYFMSLYVPDYKRGKMRDFIVKDDTLVVLYEHDVVIYRFSEDIHHKGAALRKINFKDITDR